MECRTLPRNFGSTVTTVDQDGVEDHSKATATFELPHAMNWMLYASGMTLHMQLESTSQRPIWTLRNDSKGYQDSRPEQLAKFLKSKANYEEYLALCNIKLSAEAAQHIRDHHWPPVGRPTSQTLSMEPVEPRQKVQPRPLVQQSQWLNDKERR